MNYRRDKQQPSHRHNATKATVASFPTWRSSPRQRLPGPDYRAHLSGLAKFLSTSLWTVLITACYQGLSKKMRRIGRAVEGARLESV